VLTTVNMMMMMTMMMCQFIIIIVQYHRMQALLSDPVIKLGSLRWFSQRRSPTPHFSGVRTDGAMTPNSNSAEIYVQCTYPQISCVYSFGSHRVDKQTKRRRWKHPTLFAMLRRLVTNKYEHITAYVIRRPTV